jgi:peroxiredoxin
MLHKRLVILTVAVLAAVGLVVAFVPVSAEVSVGTKAPDFKLPTMDGKTISLSDFADKPTLLVFWATWCPHCRAELPVVQKIYKDLGPKGASFVGVSLDDNSARAKDFVKSNNITFPVAVAGARNNLLGSYGITGIPTVFVLDKGGVVKARYAGEVSESTIRADLAKLGIK